MQLIESSALGLRSATHELRSTEFGARVTIFPMVHIGEDAFYKHVYAQAAEHDLVLLEGVQSKTVRNLTRSYRWLPLKRLGLVRQPRFDATQAEGEVQGADLTGEEFEALWRKVPFFKRARLAVMAPLFGLAGWFFLTRPFIAKHLGLDDLTSRDDVLTQGDMGFGVPDAIDARRDQKACRLLEQAIRDNGDRNLSIAVVYGARHMPVILRFLNELGDYMPVRSAWTTVFEL